MWSPLSKKTSYSRKVFVGGLPIDVNSSVVEEAFGVYGELYLDWPRTSDARRERPMGPKMSSNRNVTGYVFIIYQKEQSVIDLLSQCYCEDNKYYMLLSSPTMREKPVQVRPWCLGDIDYMPRPSVFLDPRRTIFIGGVPRPTRACELAFVLESKFGPVCYVGVDIDPELKYPKGAARVTFYTTKSFIAAISGRFINIPHGEANKRVEIKPYVMDDQNCDNCNGKMCSDHFAQFFCGDVSCLQYYCEICWDLVHFNDFTLKKRSAHRPLTSGNSNCQ